jgi:hypothetical protein
VITGASGDVANQYSKISSLQITFLEVQVHIRQIHLVWVHVAAPLGLAPLFFEVLVLTAINDNLHLSISSFLDVASFINILEGLQLRIGFQPLGLALLQRLLHLRPRRQLLLHVGLHLLHPLLLVPLSSLILQDLCLASSPHR